MGLQEQKQEHSAVAPELSQIFPRRARTFVNNESKSKGTVRVVPATLSSCFITCKLAKPSIDTLVSQLTPVGCENIFFSESKPEGRLTLETIMRTRNAWSQNLANIKNIIKPKDERPMYESPNPKPRTKPKFSSTSTPVTPNHKGILKRKSVGSASPISAFAQRQASREQSRTKKVSLNTDTPTVHYYEQRVDAADSDSGTIEADSEQSGLDEEEEVIHRNNQIDMSQPRPSLKLKLSTNNFQPQQTPSTGAQTPNPQAGVRTPSIKLNFGKKPSISATSTPAIKKEPAEGTTASGKKRKRTKTDVGTEDEQSKPPPPQRRLTLKTGVVPAKTPATPGPVFRLKTKGKIPKRPLGVGYDSELEEREIDPVVLEGLILRMPSGPDCDYVQAAIRDGTIGVHRAQGGADIRIRCLDTNGRRGIMFVNGHQYATTVVDLPCIVEGMKSWDKKGWIKSIDICQMMIVLGPCNSDDEAKNFPLPNDVDPKTFAYAHGLTAPMKWVRKRRFARTRRARVDDIESIERKVNALLEADAKALASSFQIFDHDPRIEQDQYSEVEDDYEDEDAEGEEDSYFPPQAGLMVQTPGGMEMDVHVDQDQIDDIEAMFNEDDEDAAAPTINGHAVSKTAIATLHAPNVRDASVAVTSASGSPSASVAMTSAATPAEEAQQASSDDDEEDDDEDDEDRSDSEKDADDNLQQVKDRIADMENKIREQTELLKKTPNAILKKKLARKIGELRDDVRMMKVQNGLAAEGDEEDGDE